MLFICYPKCTTCQKARKWLDENGLSYEVRDIKAQNPTYEELKSWHEKGGIPIRKLFNTSGMLYREMQLAKRLDDMDDEQQLRLLATDGMLVRRPLVISDDLVLVGFRQAQWEALLHR